LLAKTWVQPLNILRLQRRLREQAHSYSCGELAEINSDDDTLKSRAVRHSTVGAIGGYDGREGGGSVTAASPENEQVEVSKEPVPHEREVAWVLPSPSFTPGSP
jgi:hypothetical protein